MVTKKALFKTESRFKSTLRSVFTHMAKAVLGRLTTLTHRRLQAAPKLVRNSQKRVMANLCTQSTATKSHLQEELRQALLMLSDVLEANFVYGRYENKQERAIELAQIFAKTLDDIGIGSKLINSLNQLKRYKIKTHCGQTWDNVVRPAVRDLAKHYQQYVQSRQAPDQERLHLMSTKAAYKDAISDHEDLLSAYS